MNREQALALLKEHVQSDQLLRHSYAVEAAMIAYAKKYGEDVERWSIIGLLHDIDFEKYPDVHPGKAPDLLGAAGVEESIIHTILSHGSKSEHPRDSLERKALYAVDQMSSFIVAVALMRPQRFDGLAAKSVKKKMKAAAFAKAVSREELTESMEDLGEQFADHVATIVAGLVEQEERLQAEGFTLLG